MERRDQKKTTIHEWEGNYNSWRSETYDTSTTELSGTKREADLILRGLQALRGQLILNEASGATSPHHSDIHGSKMRSTDDTPKLDEVEKLIKSIEEPNYIAEPIVENI